MEIALADDDQPEWSPGPGEAETGASEAGSRPVTALQLRPGAGSSSRISHKSWEAFNHTEEMTQAITMREENSVESLTLPDSLNDFEGEEYQSPNLYHDSLGLPQPKLMLGSHHDVDSLQFPVSPTPKKVSQSPVDSLIEIGPSKTKINAAEFFDSITSIDKSSKPATVNFAPKRRIIPYCDNSLSSGTSAFTSQDVSFDSKESSHSPSDSDRTRQVNFRLRDRSHPANIVNIVFSVNYTITSILYRLPHVDTLAALMTSPSLSDPLRPSPCLRMSQSTPCPGGTRRGPHPPCTRGPHRG